MAEPHIMIGLRNKFYRDGLRRLQLILLLTFGVNLGLIALLVYVLTHPPIPKYFATSINGRITPLYPLDQPNQSLSSVLQWASQAALACYTYDWVHYRKNLMAASEFFTPQGWHDFLYELGRSNNLKRVTESKMVVSAVLTDPPTLLESGTMMDKTRYFWLLQMKMTVTFESASVKAQSLYNVQMRIERVSTLNTPMGIGIAQFIVQEVGAGPV